MDNNIFYLGNLFNNLTKSELDIDVLKIFFNKYLESDYLNDSFLLNNIDFSCIDSVVTKHNFGFDYRNYVKFDIIDGSPICVFLNDHLILTENFNTNIVLNTFDYFDNNFIKNILFFNDECILKNLNIFFIINILFYKKISYFSILNDNFNNKPIYILNFFNNDYKGNFYSPRSFLKIENCSNLNVFNYVNNMSDKVFVNYNTYMCVEKYSKVNYFFLNESILNSFNTYSIYSKIYNNSFLSYNNHSFGSTNSKTNCYFFLFDVFSKVTANFARLLKFKSKNDITTKVYHYGNNTFSRVLFKSVLSDFSMCNFNALIDVDFNFNNSDGGVFCKSLLLDNFSSINMLPELAIKNNDVKCFHGATVGFLEEEVLFYLMSRGFSKDECINLLIQAFLNDIIYDVSLHYFNIFVFLFEKYYKY